MRQTRRSFMLPGGPGYPLIVADNPFPHPRPSHFLLPLRFHPSPFALAFALASALAFLSVIPAENLLLPLRATDPDNSGTDARITLFYTPKDRVRDHHSATFIASPSLVTVDSSDQLTLPHKTHRSPLRIFILRSATILPTENRACSPPSPSAPLEKGHNPGRYP